MAIFKGAGVPIVTPFHEDGSVNYGKLTELLEEQIAGGTDSIIICGTTGEASTLSHEEHLDVIAHAVKVVNGRIPVIAGTGSNSTETAIYLSVEAEKAGADALLQVTPYYNKATQKGLIAHFTAVAQAVKIPIILYNVPSRTGCNILPETAVYLAKNVPNIVGIKDSTGDFTLAGEYIRLTQDKDFTVLMGRDTLIHAGLCYGAKGAIASCANVAPRLCADIYDKFVQGDLAGSLRAQQTLAPLRIAFTLGTFPAVIKEGLELLGIEAGPCMAPVGRMSEEEHAKLKGVLIEMGLLH